MSPHEHKVTLLRHEHAARKTAGQVRRYGGFDVDHPRTAVKRSSGTA